MYFVYISLFHILSYFSWEHINELAVEELNNIVDELEKNKIITRYNEFAAGNTESNHVRASFSNEERGNLCRIITAIRKRPTINRLRYNLTNFNKVK